MKILEIELKAYCEDHQSVIDKMLSMEAKFISSVKQNDIYFNHPARDFKVTDEAFRIRRVNGKIFISYKGPKLGEKTKTRLEEEVEVDDFNVMKRILEHLGFTPFGSVIKQRDVYRVDDIDVCIDKVEELGDFVELEKMDSDRTRIENKLFDLAEKLGLKRFETRSYLELKMGDT